MQMQILYIQSISLLNKKKIHNLKYSHKINNIKICKKPLIIKMTNIIKTLKDLNQINLVNKISEEKFLLDSYTNNRLNHNLKIRIYNNNHNKKMQPRKSKLFHYFIFFFF